MEPLNLPQDSADASFLVVDHHPVNVLNIGKEKYFGVKKGYMSAEQFEAIQRANALIKEKGVRTAAKILYQAQSHQKLGEERDRVVVKIFCQNLTEWKRHIDKTIKDINMAAPGLFLSTTDVEEKANIFVFEHRTGGCYTEMPKYAPGIWYGSIPKIHLEKDWSVHVSEWQRTATHEMLHALGYGHEHQRSGVGKHLLVEVADFHADQFCEIDNLKALTRFDPFSIMMYQEAHDIKRNPSDPVWNQKPHNLTNIEMSELDKVALNLLYRPCRSQSYQPRKSEITQLYYCGRHVMEHNNQPFQTNAVDGRCGPYTGPNCPACRVLKSDQVQAFQEEDKWQGWSGYIYCGRVISKGQYRYATSPYEKTCGPNNGEPCYDCERRIRRIYETIV